MVNQAANLLGVERKAHAILATGLSAAVLLLGVADKNERAVFLTEGTGLPVKAFTAIIPPAVPLHNGRGSRFRGRSYALTNNPLLGATRRSLPGSGGAIDDLLSPNPGGSAPLVSPPGATAQTPDNIVAPQLASLAPSQFAPSVFQPGGAGTTGTGTGAPGTPGTGTPGTGPIGTNSGTTGTTPSSPPTPEVARFV